MLHDYVIIFSHKILKCSKFAGLNTPSSSLPPREGNNPKTLEEETELSNHDLSKLSIEVLYERGEMMERDINCDSTFMLNHLDDVGSQIRIKFGWVPFNEEIDLVMDNAGGHGTNEAKEAYTLMLKTKHNIRVVWQTPQSPETNLLDLGIWCSLQSMVGLSHRKKCKSNRDALARTIEDVWQKFPPQKFQLVYERWRKVLKIICNTQGDNVKSDAFRGKSIIPEVDLDALQDQNQSNNLVVVEEEIDSDLEEIDD